MTFWRLLTCKTIINFFTSSLFFLLDSLDSIADKVTKVEKVYLGNVKVVWTNDQNVAAAPREGAQAAPQLAQAPSPADDLPF